MRVILNFDEDTAPIHILTALHNMVAHHPIVVDLDGDPDDAQDLAQAIRATNFPGVALDVRYIVDNDRNALLERIGELPDGEVLNVIQAANEQVRGTLAERLSKGYTEITGNTSPRPSKIERV